MPLPVMNQELVKAFPHRSELRAYAAELRSRIAEDQRQLSIASTALKVTDIHQEVALQSSDMGDGYLLICALGSDVWVHGRRSMVFQDTGRWHVRMHFRPGAGSAGRDRKGPGTYSFATEELALSAARDWAAVGKVVGRAWGDADREPPPRPLPMHLIGLDDEVLPDF